jgi:iron(III) transport system ATP-binding protein
MVLMERLHPATESAAAPTAALSVRRITKTFGGSPFPAVADLSFDVQPVEVVALLGPSGCGKTTALRLIAGLERPDAGIIEIGGRTAVGHGRWVPPHRRSAGMVFQDYALFPHLTVRGNVAYGLNRLSRAHRRERIDEVLRLTGLVEYARRHPHELSGGQQQRVAIARAIAPKPHIALLDEPFSNLDAELRVRVRSQALDLLRLARVAVVLVTHDQDEAFVAADRIAVMSQGRIHQIGTAETLYAAPATRFVAQFVGVANFLPASARNGAVDTPLGSFALNGAVQAPVEVLLRPEEIEVVPSGDGGVPALVEQREFHGHDCVYVARIESGQTVRIITPAHEPLEAGDHVRLRARNARPVMFAAGDQEPNGATGSSGASRSIDV